MKPYAVFWRCNERIGSVPLGQLPEVKKQFRLSLIQKDDAGTEFPAEKIGESP